MNIVYYSHTGNTEHFVNEHLIPQMKLHPVKINGDNPRGLIEGPAPIRALSVGGPHQALSHTDAPLQPGHTLLVFPIYARADHETGETFDTVPEPIQDIIALLEQAGRKPLAAISVGNRTFGGAYGKVNDSELFGVPHLGTVEMSGTPEEALEMVKRFNSLVQDFDFDANTGLDPYHPDLTN